MLYHCDNLTFQILTVQKYHWKKSRSLVEPRSYCSLTYRISGNGTFRMGNREFTSNPGDVLYLPADEGYDVDYSDNEIFVVHFLQNVYSGSGENYSFRPSAPFEDLFHTLWNRWTQPDTTMFECNALVYQLLDLLRRCATEVQNPQDSFHRALQYLNQNFHNPQLSLAEVCLQCGISEATLRAKFVREYNQPPVKYLQNLRISCATRLLAERKFSVEEVAEQSGFSDPKYFSRVMKRALGVPPSHLFNRF